MRMESISRILVNAGLGVEGDNLFMHYMPPDAYNGILLLPSLGGSLISVETPGWRKDVGFQAIVRCSNLDDGIPLAAKVSDALTISKRTMLPAISELNIPALLVSYIRPLSDPQPYPRMDDGSFEVSTNFFITYAIQGAVL